MNITEEEFKSLVEDMKRMHQLILGLNEGMAKITETLFQVVQNG